MKTPHNHAAALVAQVLCAAIVAAAVAGCTASSVLEEDAAAGDIETLEARVTANPDDAAARRDLGVSYFAAHRYASAKEHLAAASAALPLDPRAAFYLGLTFEYEGKRDSAFEVYRRYAGLPESEYRKLMEGRYLVLNREIVKDQFQTLLAREDELAETRPAPNAVAVFPLSYLGLDQKYAPLSLGLSEMMTIDLSQVRQLTLVERIRIGALLAELRLGTSKAIDPATAPRMGKLLGAAKIVGGSFNVSSDNLRMDVIAMDVGKGERSSKTASQADELENLFRVEKEVVFGILNELGIVPTPEERERIQRIPTQNLQAFLKYSIGLEQEDRGDYSGAEASYQDAVSLDPSFGIAGGKARQNDAIVSADTKDKAITSAHNADPVRRTPPATVQTLQTSRLENLSSSIGSGFVPGQEDRKPAQEAANAGNGGNDLPPPPPPPPR